jgi:hypothetical protein
VFHGEQLVGGVDCGGEEICWDRYSMESSVGRMGLPGRGSRRGGDPAVDLAEEETATPAFHGEQRGRDGRARPWIARRSGSR